jgi:2'-5' RNA ligase
VQEIGPSNRLFVALDLPGEARERLGALAREAAGRLDGRAVPPERLHLTLSFLGRIDPGRGPAVAAAVREALSGAPAVPARVVALAGTPGRRPSRLCAAVLADEEGALRGAWSAVRDAVPAAAGLRPQHGDLWPHVTLVRLRRPTRLPSSPVDGEQAFVFRRASLYDSRTGRDGPRYVSLVDVPLVAADHSD